MLNHLNITIFNNTNRVLSFEYNLHKRISNYLLNFKLLNRLIHQLTIVIYVFISKFKSGILIKNVQWNINKRCWPEA